MATTERSTFGIRRYDIDSRHATVDDYGNITAKNQHGVDVNAKPRKSDNQNWEFGDSLAGITPTKIA